MTREQGDRRHWRKALGGVAGLEVLTLIRLVGNCWRDPRQAGALEKIDCSQTAAIWRGVFLRQERPEGSTALPVMT